MLYYIFRFKIKDIHIYMYYILPHLSLSNYMYFVLIWENLSRCVEPPTWMLFVFFVPLPGLIPVVIIVVQSLPYPLKYDYVCLCPPPFFWYSANYYGLHWWGSPLLWLFHTAFLVKLSLKNVITEKLTVGVNCCNPIRKIKEKSTSTITISFKMVSQRP